MSAGALPGRDAAGDVQRATTNASGRFCITGLKALPVTLTARKAGYVLFGPPPVARARQFGDLVLRPLGRVGLRAVDAVTRDPVRVVRFDLDFPSGCDLGGHDIGMRGAELPEDGWDGARAEQWFTFRLDDVRNTKDSITSTLCTVTALGYRPRKITVRVRWPEDPDYAKATSVELDPTFHAGDVGRLTVAFDCPSLERPLATASVVIAHGMESKTLEGRLAWIVPLVLSGRGDAELPLPAGDYEVAAGQPPGWLSFRPAPTPRRVRIEPGGRASVTFRLDAAMLALRVFDSSGTSLPEFAVTVHGNTGTDVRLVTYPMDCVLRGDEFSGYRKTLHTAPGVLEIPLHEGSHSIEVWKLGYRPAMLRVDCVGPSRIERSVTLAD